MIAPEFEIKDIKLAPSGHKKIDWVRKNCPLLRSLEEDFTKEQPFKGIRVALSIHLEAKTAYLCKVLAAGGAEMYITGSIRCPHRMMWQRLCCGRAECICMAWLH